MGFKAAQISLLAFVLSGLVQRGNTACKELQPVEGFQNDFAAGKLYWIFQKYAFDIQGNSNCYVTYSFVDGNIWTFLDSYQNEQGYEHYAKVVGVMDIPGHWNTRFNHLNGTPFNYSYSVIAGKSKKYALTYACNHDSGDYALWLFYFKRVSPEQVDKETQQEVTRALSKNNLTFVGVKPMDQNNCVCK